MSDLRCDLIDAGHLFATDIDGVLGRGAMFEAVLVRLDQLIGQWGKQNGAEPVHFPPVMNRAHLERNGYIKSFPQLATALHGFSCDHAGRAIAEDQPTGLVMTPSACYPIYPMVAARAPLPAGGALFDIQSWCFRREPSKNADRLQSFRMHEYVRLGTEVQVLAFRDAWLDEAARLCDSLQLPFRFDGANDAFFGRAGQLMASSQRERHLKIELLIPIIGDAAPTACGSFNYAEDHFTETWKIALQDGSKAVSGCIGIGLERTTLALFRHHGPDFAKWPAAVQNVLQVSA
jgi:seryl-tRNA synthetase